MTIENVKFETHLYSREEIEAVIKFGVKVEGRLTRPFICTFDWNGKRWRFELPVEYAATPSIPRWLRSIKPATGAVRWISYFHDFGYEFHSMTRADLDDLMVAGMKAGGDGWRTRQLVWGSIRTGGWRAWSKHEGEVTLKGLTLIYENADE